MLLSNLRSLTQLYTLTMDVHARLRTDAHQTVTGRQQPQHALQQPSVVTSVVQACCCLSPPTQTRSHKQV
jgi:hypothetical protein